MKLIVSIKKFKGLLIWKQWKNPKHRVRHLKKRDIAHHDAMRCGNARKESHMDRGGV
ncbi:hypothetical protein [uncultured Desulfobacter sp.]|uniref:hypothetical protein n=1 Tax=uncultured Desulfobacter sp. TaxID=240139 RepID=UPI0029F48062|nr:hypothetical protein [uncultured Desulfobacter sp.]